MDDIFNFKVETCSKLGSKFTAVVGHSLYAFSLYCASRYLEVQVLVLSIVHHVPNLKHLLAIAYYK